MDGPRGRQDVPAMQWPRLRSNASSSSATTGLSGGTEQAGQSVPAQASQRGQTKRVRPLEGSPL
ncbi:MAG TPA: hypothetical protein VGR50_04720, partial [Terriglobales bacterium]|nr:hypothetical protein [Terriglobales bacterium]